MRSCPRIVRAALAALSPFASTTATAQAPPILLESGGAAPGQMDPNVTYLGGPRTSAFGAAAAGGISGSKFLKAGSVMDVLGGGGKITGFNLVQFET